MTQDDIDFLKKNTRYDEQEIKEWYRYRRFQFVDNYCVKSKF